MRNILKNKVKGISSIETIIVAALIVFIFLVVFYVMGNILSGAILTEKRVELVNELDNRVNNFMLTKNFDDSKLRDMSFSRTTNNTIQEFIATNQNFSIEIIKRGYAGLGKVEQVMNEQLGAYMQKVNEIYINAGATSIDQLNLLPEIELARDTYLSSSTMKHSSNTMVLLNLGNTQLNITTPLENPPFDYYGPYVTIGPHTNNDITSNGVVWTCTAYNFDSELLPSWCIV